jgi:Acetokinase family
MPAPAAVGHRIVHGGPKLWEDCLIDDLVLRQLGAASAFAPLHITSALSAIRFAQEHFPGLPQVACFDTSFTPAFLCSVNGHARNRSNGAHVGTALIRCLGEGGVAGTLLAWLLRPRDVMRRVDQGDAMMQKKTARCTKALRSLKSFGAAYEST